ncbi:hypothetical protein [Glycomyces arizonensis]|uniref:hypothetical protein n=1 Tax=Glycomyces arizonensis TaxID=256035 RepID=UPI0003F51284|nr:hypothetical protein [Glycomyces arizonensis]
MTGPVIVAALALLAVVWIGAWVLADHLTDAPAPEPEPVVIDQDGRLIAPRSHRAPRRRLAAVLHDDSTAAWPREDWRSQ